jgi:hypothetical protein
MATGEVHILPTGNTPEFIFKHEGYIKIKGRGLFETNTEFFEQILNWIDEYLRKLSQAIRLPKKLVIQWYLEEDDDDILERGECISSTLDIPIEFIVTNNIASC